MIRKIKFSPFVVHVLSTTGASMVTLAANIFVLRFLAEGLGTEKFGAYSLASRLMAFLLPFSTLALGIALSRFVSLSMDERTKRGYLLSGFLLGIAPNLLILIGGTLFAGPLVLLVFHDTHYQTLFFMTLFWTTAFFFYTVLDGYYFGSGKIRKANLWQIFLGSIGPLVIAWSFSKQGSVDWIIFLLGILYFTASIPLGFHLSRALAAKPAWTEIQPRIKELWNYALTRFPARFLLATLFSLGPFLASYFGSIRDAGFLVVGQMILRLAELGSTAFGRVVLPKAGELFSGGRQEYLKERIEDIVTFVFHTGIFVTLQLILWSDQIILVWLGPQYVEVIPVMQILILAVAPYLLFIMLSSIVDTIDERSVNVRHLLVCFIVALFSSVVLGKIFSKIGLAFGTTLALITLGFLTVFYLWKVYRISFQTLEIKKILLWNFASLFAGLILKNVLTVHLEGFRLIGSGIIGEAAFLFLYLLVLWKLRPRWIGELEKRLFIIKFPSLEEAQ
ncbi:MAG: lipopolysaccharide biosynthesis protein [Candidatus Omnitrophica bacterium]|nr:lipopolysaccharide biosynthesis protein [Candidatus Omnitrophota bacterium]